jgi:hypothetical protein
MNADASNALSNWVVTAEFMIRRGCVGAFLERLTGRLPSHFENRAARGSMSVSIRPTNFESSSMRSIPIERRSTRILPAPISKTSIP